MEMPNSVAASFGVSRRLFFIREVYGQWQALSSFLEGRANKRQVDFCEDRRRCFHPNRLSGDGYARTGCIISTTSITFYSYHHPFTTEIHPLFFYTELGE